MDHAGNSEINQEEEKIMEKAHSIRRSRDGKEI
jgi:hypothetical protein